MENNEKKVYNIKKTAVIGIGGTGKYAILNMKKKLIETYGEIPPMIKFLVFDTTAKDKLITPEGEDDIVLDPGEFLKMDVKNPDSLVKTKKEVKDWLPEGVPMFALSNGAKQVRPLGRLAVFANIKNVEKRINSLVKNVRNYKSTVNSRYKVAAKGNIVVNIICSFSGGTGSGCFLDIATIVKGIIGKSKLNKMVGYFLLPDIFADRDGCKNVQPNAFGALRELSNSFNNNFKYSYNLGGIQRKMETGLFSTIYLVNNINRLGIEYTEENDLYELMGMGMFLQSTAAGKDVDDILDNVEGHLYQERFFDKPTVFSSFGISELVYPSELFTDIYASEIASNVITESFMGGDTSNITEFTENFINKIDIREDTADTVIDAILLPGLYNKFALPKNYKKSEIVNNISTRYISHIDDVKKNLKKESKKNLETFIEIKLNLLQNEIKDIINKPCGIVFVKSFLSTLKGKLSQYNEMMVKEKDDFQKRNETIKVKFKVVKQDLEKAAKKLFNAKSAINDELVTIQSYINKESEYLLEIERREKAITFFTLCRDDIEKWIAKVNTFSDSCIKLVESLNEFIQMKKLERGHIKPFSKEIETKSLAFVLPNMGPNDFLKWLDKKNMTVHKLMELRLKEIKTILLDYGNSIEEVDNLKNESIESILSKLPEDKRIEYISELDNMASPLWQYDEGRIAAEYGTSNIYLFGVENELNTIFTPEELSKSIEFATEPNVISTGDPKRIVCFKVETALPAFVIYDMETYRNKYYNPKKPFPYNIHKDWDRTLPTLFPSSEEEEFRKYWSVGLSDPFNLISRRGQYYYIKSEKTGGRLKQYNVKLTNGRPESMQVFLDNEDLIEETQQKIDEIVEKIGINAIIDSLKKHGEDLEKNADKYGKKIKKQIELELSDIENFINSLQSW